MSTVWVALAGIVGTLLLLWIALVAYLLVARPDRATIAEILRLLPDTLRLVRRLVTDRTIPFRARLPIFVLLGYLLLPIDLIPDFIPVVGYADDAIVTSIALRYFIRRAGSETITASWPGTPEGLARLQRLLRLPE